MRGRGKDPWFLAPRHQAYTNQFEQVSSVEWRQASTFDRFARLEGLYDPATCRTQTDRISVITENLVATNVDTAGAAITTTEVRARYMTEDADWSTQRLARQLELYTDGLAKLFDVHAKCQTAYQLGAELKGNAINRVDIDPFGEPYVTPVMVDDIVVDDEETDSGGEPLSLHQIHRHMDAETLKAQYPEAEDEINKATSSFARRGGAGLTRPVSDTEVVVIESWRLPVGAKGKKGYKPGRYLKSIEGKSLVDKKYEEPGFPHAVARWSTRPRSWYGISLAERIEGHQLTLNRRNWHIQRLGDQNAAPTGFVRPADANIKVQNAGPLGTMAVCKADYPQYIMPPLINGDLLRSRDDIKRSASEETGVSPAMAQGTVSPGLESGAAVREERLSRTQRFATQEKAFERFVLDTLVLLVGVCKRLGKDAPRVVRQTRFGTRVIKWSDVDMGEVKVQIAAASPLARTPAGRQQTVLEWAQAGVISMDESRRLLQHPDLERSMSLYTAALEGVEHALDEIQDGKIVMPEPYDNHKMCVWRGQAQYLITREQGAPEDILEGLRQYVSQAAWYVAMASAPAPANANAAMSGAPAEAVPDPNAPMPISGAPMEAPAQAAFSPQAMALRAG